MAILDPIEDIRAARKAGLPLGDPAKLEKIIRAGIDAIEKSAEDVDARMADVFMATENVARIMLTKTEKPEWDKATRAHYHATFLNTLAKALARDLDKRMRMP